MWSNLSIEEAFWVTGPQRSQPEPSPHTELNYSGQPFKQHGVPSTSPLKKVGPEIPIAINYQRFLSHDHILKWLQGCGDQFFKRHKAPIFQSSGHGCHQIILVVVSLAAAELWLRCWKVEESGNGVIDDNCCICSPINFSKRGGLLLLCFALWGQLALLLGCADLWALVTRLQ